MCTAMEICCHCGLLSALFAEALTAVLPAQQSELQGHSLHPTADVPTLGAIPSGLPKLRPLILPRELLPQIAQSAVMLAVLGSIDSLLTSLVADSLTSTYHDSDKELIGQVTASPTSWSIAPLIQYLSSQCSTWAVC